MEKNPQTIIFHECGKYNYFEGNKILKKQWSVYGDQRRPQLFKNKNITKPVIHNQAANISELANSLTPFALIKAYQRFISG